MRSVDRAAGGRRQLAVRSEAGDFINDPVGGERRDGFAALRASIEEGSGAFQRGDRGARRVQPVKFRILEELVLPRSPDVGSTAAVTLTSSLLGAANLPRGGAGARRGRVRPRGR